MITTLVGKTFLNAYNEKYKQNYSAKEFFEKVYFELFFNHPKYMQWVTNSPFVQGITTDDYGKYGKEIGKEKKYEKEEFEKKFEEAISTYGKERISKKTEKSKNQIKIILKNDEIQRRERLEDFHKKVILGIRDGSIAIGYPASEEKEYGTYSGAVTDIVLEVAEEDVYYSWIGGALGIGVEGGFNLLIYDADIALEIFEGWQYYRKYLNDPSLVKLKGNQINSWNGQWLTFCLGKGYREKFSFFHLEQESFFKINSNLMEVDTVKWSNLYFSLSNQFPNKTLNSYVYKLGEKNETIGFIPIYLKEGRRLKDIFKQLFHTETPFETKEFQSLYGMHIKRACELGNIGLHALRPESLKKYMEESRNIPFSKDKEKRKEQILIYQSYKTWLIAMISKNKEQITDYTEKVTKILFKYSNSSEKTDRRNLVQNSLLSAKTKKVFIDSLTEIVKSIDKSELEDLRELKNRVHLMSNEEFGYFNTLLKFDYAFIETQF